MLGCSSCGHSVISSLSASVLISTAFPPVQRSYSNNEQINTSRKMILTESDRKHHLHRPVCCMYVNELKCHGSTPKFNHALLQGHPLPTPAKFDRYPSTHSKVIMCTEGGTERKHIIPATTVGAEVMISLVHKHRRVMSLVSLLSYCMLYACKQTQWLNVALNTL